MNNDVTSSEKGFEVKGKTEPEKKNKEEVAIHGDAGFGYDEPVSKPKSTPSEWTDCY